MVNCVFLSHGTVVLSSESTVTQVPSIPSSFRVHIASFLECDTWILKNKSLDDGDDTPADRLHVEVQCKDKHPIHQLSFRVETFCALLLVQPGEGSAVEGRGTGDQGGFSRYP